MRTCEIPEMYWVTGSDRISCIRAGAESPRRRGADGVAEHGAVARAELHAAHVPGARGVVPAAGEHLRRDRAQAGRGGARAGRRALGHRDALLALELAHQGDDRARPHRRRRRALPFRQRREAHAAPQVLNALLPALA